MSVRSIESSLASTYRWLNEFKEMGHFRDESQAYSVLRIVLHELRNHLPLDISAHLSSQLPLFLKGMYFDGWDPSKKITRDESFEDFIAPMRSSISNLDVNLKESVRECFHFITSKLDDNLAAKVINSLPESLRNALMVS
ncbi:DUF2267 domain-containing protein [Legionella cardiaca]|uniref:DUF2267 domain-containing protein n=1 Tax=Legionella cardiaca TaxID=1071983 RepID=A0ABY8AWM5_9GAMM|nr:DUF2267 domain-containing protein [Legionella cardiaca]WED43537.1 DUF2267 domain-containing protein [Legionella cardiaca]